MSPIETPETLENAKQKEKTTHDASIHPELHLARLGGRDAGLRDIRDRSAASARLTWGWGRSRGLFRGRMACVIFLSCFSIQGLSPVARPGGVASPCRSKLTYGRRSESAAPTSRLRAVRTQGDVTSLLPGVESHATNRFVHLGLPGMISCPAIAFTFLCAAGSSRLHDRPFDHDPGSHVFPQRDQQLAR